MLLSMDEVVKKPAIQFLFISEYLIRKSQIEYQEQKRQIDAVKNKR